MWFCFLYRCASCLPQEITWWKKGKYCVKRSNSWGNSGCQRRLPNPWHLLLKPQVTLVPKMMTLVTQTRKKSVTRDTLWFAVTPIRINHVLRQIMKLWIKQCLILRFINHRKWSCFLQHKWAREVLSLLSPLFCYITTACYFLFSWNL